jgi:hypothetical protein
MAYRPVNPVNTGFSHDELLTNCKSPKDFRALMKMLYRQNADTALQSEISVHPGYDKRADGYFTVFPRPGTTCAIKINILTLVNNSLTINNN